MMGTIASNLTKLAETKSAIKQAIVDKGVKVADTDTFASYAEKIAGIAGMDGENVTIKPSSMSFNGCTFKDPTPIAKCLDTSATTTLYGCFRDGKWETLDLSTWDVGNVKNMDYCFQGCSNAKSLNVSGWVTTKCTSLHRTFADMGKLEELTGIEDWDVSNVTSLMGTFRSLQFKILDLSKWDVSNVLTLGGTWEGLFYGCSNLETVDVSTWDTSNVGAITYLFNSCYSLKSVDLSGWNMGTIDNANNTKNVFDGCKNLTTIIGDHTIDEVETGTVVAMRDLKVGLSLSPTILERPSLLAVIKGLADLTESGTTQTLTLGSTLLAKLTDEDKKIATDKGWTLA